MKAVPTTSTLSSVHAATDASSSSPSSRTPSRSAPFLSIWASHQPRPSLPAHAIRLSPISHNPSTHTLNEPEQLPGATLVSKESPPHDDLTRLHRLDDGWPPPIVPCLTTDPPLRFLSFAALRHRRREGCPARARPCGLPYPIGPADAGARTQRPCLPIDSPSTYDELGSEVYPSCRAPSSFRSTTKRRWSAGCSTRCAASLRGR